MYSNVIICCVLEFIDNNILHKIDIQYLANKNYINRFYLMKLFKKEIGVTINNYINCIRVYKSLDIIRNNSVLKSALNSGFYSQEYYSEIFKKIIGVPPIIYKKYVNYSKDVSISNINIILKNVLQLKDIINKKETYLNNRLPQENLRVLSLFKI